MFHDLREKTSLYTRLVWLLKGSDVFSLPVNLQSKYQTCYNHTLSGAWLSYFHLPNVRTKFSFCGNIFMISKDNIDATNLDLFILSRVLDPPKQSLEIMPFCSHIYCRSNYLNSMKYKDSISMYSMCINGYVCGNFNRKNLLFIDGHPCTHGDIAGFINSSMCSLFFENYSFEEKFNDQELFIKRKASRFFCCECSMQFVS